MTRRLRTVAGAAPLAGLLAVASLAAAPAVLAGDPCYHGYTIPAATTASTSAVKMEACAFVPTNVRVATGATVTFTNGSYEPHLLTGANQAWGDREKEIAPGASLSVTFDKPGVYAFSCSLHRGMSGAVIVGGAEQEAGVAAAGAAGEDGGGATSGGGTDTGLIASISIAGLAALAAIGWAAALLQRRRLVAAEAARATIG